MPTEFEAQAVEAECDYSQDWAHRADTESAPEAWHTKECIERCKGADCVCSGCLQMERHEFSLLPSGAADDTCRCGGGTGDLVHQPKPREVWCSHRFFHLMPNGDNRCLECKKVFPPNGECPKCHKVLPDLDRDGYYVGPHHEPEFPCGSDGNGGYNRAAQNIHPVKDEL